MSTQTNLLNTQQLAGVEALQSHVVDLGHRDFLDNDGAAYFESEMEAVAGELFPVLIDALKGRYSRIGAHVESTRVQATLALMQDANFRFMDGALAGTVGRAQIFGDEEIVERGFDVAARLRNIHAGTSVTNQLFAFGKLISPSIASRDPIWNDVESEYDNHRLGSRRSRFRLNDDEKQELRKWSYQATDMMIGLYSDEDRQRLREMDFGSKNAWDIMKFIKFVIESRGSGVYGLEGMLESTDLVGSLSRTIAELSGRIPIVPADEAKRKSLGHLLSKANVMLQKVSASGGGWGGSTDTSLFEVYMNCLHVPEEKTGSADFDNKVERARKATQNGSLA